MDGKREFIIAKRLCLGCLKWGHLNSNCRVRKICKVCSEAHPTSLHGDNRKSRSKLATKSKDDSPKPRQEPNKVKDSSNEDTTISNCIEVCKTNTYSGPISHSLIVPVWLYHKKTQITKSWYTRFWMNSQMRASLRTLSWMK